MATPGDYPTNLELWLKADALTGLSDGDPIGSWTDSSGVGNTATASSTARPTYKTSIVNGKPVARFAGAQKMASAASVGGAAQTIVAVVKSTDLSATNTIRGGGGGNGGLQFRIEAASNPAYLRFVKESLADIGSGNVAVTASTWHVVTGTWDDASNAYAFTIDATAAGSGTSSQNVSAFTSTTIGGHGTSGEFFIGDIAELAAWSTVLNSTDLGAVVLGLRVKYGMVSTPAAGTASGAFTWAGAASGKRTPKGSASGAFTWAGAATGKRAPSGAGSGAFTWAGAAVGDAPAIIPPSAGTASGSFTWTGSASGVALPAGSASGSFAWSGSAVGLSDRSGTGSGAFSWAGAAEGSNSSTPMGSASGGFAWNGTGLAFGSNGDLSTDPTVGVGTMPTGSVAVVPLVPSTELDYAIPVMRKSVLAPVLSAEYPAHPEPGHPDAPDTVESVVGYVHLWIDGQDVTYWRGGMTVIRRWESEAPFGDTVAAFEFPQRNPWDKDGEGDLSFLRPDAPVVIGIVEPTVGEFTTTWRTRRLWSGFLDASGSGLGEGEDYTYEAKGTLWQAQSRIREPHAIIEPVDIGVWIARVLNASEGRNWKALPLTPIGITTMTRGSRDEYDMEYVQALLTEAITDDLRQWTLVEVLPGILRLVLKPAPSTVHATVAYGTPGVDIDLRVDQSTRVDRVFMRGWGPKMAGWANITYPHLELLNAPAYPNSDTTDYLGLGTTDADTDTGTGVTTWQRRVAELKGFANPPVSGVMTSDWVAVIDDLQRRVGVTADGSLGPQTWNATFDRGVPDSEALTPRRLPMASKPWANHWLYSANGRILGVNPEWDSSAIVRDVAIDAGPGKTKAQGFKLARKILGRYGEAAANGTITWTFDPNETNRTRLSHLSNVKVLGYQGTDRVLQVASKTVELEAGDAGPVYVVTTRVDERARDAMAVEDLLEQRRSALPDPSRRPGNPTKSSRQVSDQRIPWDSESPCGVLRRTAVNGASGLWTVVTIPFAEVGKLAGIRMRSDQPFAMVLFASLRITENKLASIVGNPFSGSDKWRDVKDLLDEYGVIEAWGEQDQACGYSPKTETAIPPGTAGPFTGDFIFDSPVDYWTESPPYVSVAIYMRGGSGWIEGEFLPAYEV